MTGRVHNYIFKLKNKIALLEEELIGRGDVEQKNRKIQHFTMHIE